MMRNTCLVFTIAIALGCASPSVAERVLSQAEMEQLLARGGTTPQAMGMKQFRVCWIVGIVKKGGSGKVTEQYAASAAIQRRLEKYAEEWNVTKPDWKWSVQCEAQWQLVSPGLIQVIGGAKVVDAFLVPPPEPHVPVRLQYKGTVWSMSDQQSLEAYYACRTVDLPHEGVIVQVRKSDCVPASD